jgi:hypothetical protein
MKLISAFLILTITSISFADTFYVRRTGVSAGATEAEGSRLRASVANHLSTNANNTKVSTGAQAKIIYHPLLEKDAQGYICKLEVYSHGKLLGTKQITAQRADQLDDVAKKLVDDSNALSANAASTNGSLPQKNNESYEITERAASSGDSASVGENSSIVEAKKQALVKNWHIALGPVLSTSLLGTNIGTKYAVDFGYNFSLAEHWDLMYFYDGNFNTSSQGSTPVSIVGVRSNYFISDRLAHATPFLGADIGYGGANRNEDASGAGALSLGYHFFRNTDFIFEVMYRHEVLVTTSTTGIGNYPSIDQLTFGIYF